MKVRAPIASLALLALLTTTGCKKKANRYVFGGHEWYPDATVAVGNRTTNPGGRVIEFKPGELGENEVATLTYPTPCGKATVTASATKPPNDSGAILVDFPRPKEVVTLYFDPALEGHELDSPRRKIPSPKDTHKPTSHVDVIFADCPRTVKVDGRTVKIPDSRSAQYVLVAASAKSCYVSGVALYGPKSGLCEEEASDKLTGQDAYAIRRLAGLMFEPVATKVKSSTSCGNITYLQTCD